MIWFINDRRDIEKYVTNWASSDVPGRNDDLISAIQYADHPMYGTDWTEWLSENVPALVKLLSELS